MSDDAKEMIRMILADKTLTGDQKAEILKDVDFGEAKDSRDTHQTRHVVAVESINYDKTSKKFNLEVSLNEFGKKYSDKSKNFLIAGHAVSQDGGFKPLDGMGLTGYWYRFEVCRKNGSQAPAS